MTEKKGVLRFFAEIETFADSYLPKQPFSVIVPLMTIWVINDGKPGHFNQSLGLIEALQRRVPVDCHCIDIKDLGIFSSWHKVTRADLPKPDIILGAGHKTHVPVLAAARKHKAYSFLCMKPSLPISLFDLCFIPYHDLAPTYEELEKLYDDVAEGNVSLSKHIFPTMGAMHRVTPHPGSSKDFTLVLVGGPSKFFSWDTTKLIKQLKVIEIREEGQRIVLTTSRRTPKGVVESLRREFPQMEIFPAEETGPDWVPRHLEHARQVWVTEDSVSMIFEAVGSGAFVGLLQVPKKAVGTPRVALGIRLLQHENYVNTFLQWKTGRLRVKQAVSLREADRAAEFILERYSCFRPENE